VLPFTSAQFRPAWRARPDETGHYWQETLFL